MKISLTKNPKKRPTADKLLMVSMLFVYYTVSTIIYIFCKNILYSWDERVLTLLTNDVP